MRSQPHSWNSRPTADPIVDNTEQWTSAILSPRPHHPASPGTPPATRGEQDLRHRWMITAATVLLIAVVYWPVRQGGFVWDDIINFVENDWLQAGSQ